MDSKLVQITCVLKMYAKHNFSCLQLDKEMSTYLLNKKFKLCIGWYPSLEDFTMQ